MKWNKLLFIATVVIVATGISIKSFSQSEGNVPEMFEYVEIYQLVLDNNNLVGK
jgi:hypothetical protein